EFSQPFRDTLDLAQGLPSLIGQLRPLDHLTGTAFHSDHGLMRFALDRIDQTSDLPGGVGGALCQAFDFLGHDDEGAARFTSSGSLNRGVESQDTGALSNIADELDDLTDLLRAFAETLDALGGLLHLSANAGHALDGVLHRRSTLPGIG